MITDALYRRTKDVLAIGERDPDVTLSVPLTLESRSNVHVATQGARMAQASRHKRQRDTIAMYLSLCDMPKQWSRLAVRLVRISPRLLDDDNLAASLKSVRDGVASVLRVDDRDPRVTWVCDQYQGKAKEHAVLIEVYRLPQQDFVDELVENRSKLNPDFRRMVASRKDSKALDALAHTDHAERCRKA